MKYRVVEDGKAFIIATYVDYDEGTVDEFGLPETKYLVPCRHGRIRMTADIQHFAKKLRCWCRKTSGWSFTGREPEWDLDDIMNHWF